MTQPIEIVFLDIDGTIFYDNAVVPSAANAIRLLQGNGVHVILCTGRSVLHTKHIQSALNIQHAVYFNGGLAKHGNEVLRSSPLEPHVVNRIFDFTSEHDMPIILHTDEEAIIFHDIPDQYGPLLRSFDYPPLRKLTHEEWSHADAEVYQVNVMMEPTWDIKTQNTLPECLIYRWDFHAIDLQKRGCDKSHGASDILKHLQIPAERAIHIGDGGNDVGMFETMGIGIAMGNATEDVKQYADIVTKAANEDGVFHALQQLKLI